MAISDKLNYLIETKSQLKDMINYGLPTENQITNETTFRNYVKSIFEAFLESLRDSTTLYTNLPKISGNGTQITLNDTANAPMRITLNPSALSQDGTPTPDSPQDIHTISGDNEIVVCGKNLLVPITQETKNSVNLSLNGTAITLNGTASSATSIGITYFTLPAGTYTFCKKYISGTTGGSVQILVRKQGESANISQISFNGTTYSNDQYSNLTLTEKTTIYYYIYFANGRVLTNLKFNLQLVKGDTADYNFEPYVSQTAQVNLGNIEYCKIGDYEDEFIYNTTDTSLELNQWYLKKNIGKELLPSPPTGSSTELNGIRFNYYVAKPISGYPQLYCSYFGGASSYGQSINEGGNTPNLLGLNANGVILCNVSGYTTLTEYRTLFTNNNIYIYYPLKEPTYTQITGTLETQLENIYKNMLSYKGTTNISQVNNDLPFVLGVSAIQDLE